MEILSQILRKEHRQADLTLDEDEDFVYMRHRGKLIATFIAFTVPIKMLWNTADEYLAKEVKDNGNYISGR